MNGDAIKRTALMCQILLAIYNNKEMDESNPLHDMDIILEETASLVVVHS